CQFDYSTRRLKC
nr:Chain E, L5Y meditope [synthetic construct]5F88_F Chain F, L5Y meditope [synthetic construct]